MYKSSHYSLNDATLNKFIERFVPDRGVYYFDDDQIFCSLLKRGITVYSPQELLRSFPTFSLDYGSIYHIWDLSLSDTAFVSRLNLEEFTTLNPVLQRTLLEYQVKCGRGHVYDEHWFSDFEQPNSNVVTVDSNRYYLLTLEDWQQFSVEDRKRWIIKWLKNWDENTRVETILDEHVEVSERVPYNLVKKYAGTYAEQSGPNCFAAAIAMVVGGEQCHTLISQWLHQEPFFRLLEAHVYSKVTMLHEMDFSLVEPADVLVWITENHVAGHAAYAVTGDLVFQKHGQGWESPWQILMINDVWYNEYLDAGGSISIYRRNIGMMHENTETDAQRC
ncbi:hypothetical protein [Sulfoacidibacillus ferrooxidans]|uniref:Uncharacterized protein n=1 Tax=Sulfoacidibacillus ferrooxidans TaxID=2005001 RepID=A0A9X2AD27_9BACL|nr:hypothetical protein [Sulfoacidibacillus ferrooxidans]MCI0184808.1 hypothetical protein [Sulfoacidibacillus ferrooxidans]